MNTEKASEMRDLVIAVGGSMEPTENRKSYLTRVAETAGISIRAAFAAFYNEPTSQRARRLLENSN